MLILYFFSKNRISFYFISFFLKNLISFLFIPLNVVFGSSDTENSFREFSRIPIRSFPYLSDQKFMEFQIEGISYLALIDTGSALSFIRKDVLNKIENKKHVSDSEFISVNDDRYFTSNFQIPQIQIGDLFTEAVFKEEDEKFWTKSSLIGSNSYIYLWKIHLMYQVFREGVIGMDIFGKFVCVFDFPHSNIFLADKVSQIFEKGFLEPDEFYSLPFKLGKAGPILTFETDFGEKKFLLDSGSTFSIIRLTEDEKKTFLEKDLSLKYIKSDLFLNNKNLGAWKFLVVDISSEIDDIDGIIGIDFFNKNTLCFDFQNQVVYIQSPKLGSKERFNYWVKGVFGK